MKLFKLIAVAAIAFGFAGSAYADCKPPCKDGEVCRYEAAGGTFYCALPPKKGVLDSGTGVIPKAGGSNILPKASQARTKKTRNKHK